MEKPKYKTIKIDPGTFVQGPFIECPKCHEKAYGILSVNPSSFQRRCKSCWFESDETHSGRYYLPPLQKKIVYLDQFVISNFMKCLNKASKSHSRIDPIWKRLFIKIDTLCKLQLITCPSSVLHEHESVMMRDLFEAIKSMYDLLSAGDSFNHHVSIQNDQLATAFDAWLSGAKSATYDFGHRACLPHEINHWTKGYFVTVSRNISDETVKAIISDRKAEHEEMTAAWEDWLKVKKYDPEDYSKRQLWNFKKFYLQSYAEWFKNTLVSMAGGAALDSRVLFPPPAVSLVSAFKRNLEERGYADREAFAKLREFFESEICSSVPFLKIKGAMFKQLYLRASRGQKRAPNQGMMNDIETVSTILPYCDAAFIDKECHGLLLDKEMREVMSEYKTKVFSLSTLKEFEEYLDEIEKSQSKMHRVAVKSLYGENGPTPFLTLYDKR